MQQATFRSTDGTTVPIRSYVMPLPAGDAGVKLTVRLMLAKVNGGEGASHPGVRAWAIENTRRAPDRDDWAQAQALFHAVKSKIRFIGELDETVQNPWLTLQLGAGDCDDHTTLLVALLRSIGIPARIETIATDASRQFNHVFAIVGIRQRGQLCEWRPLDSTVTFAVPGWRPPNATRSQVWTSVRDGLGYGTSSDTPHLGGTMRMEPGMNGFWSSIFHGSLKAGTIALRTAEGYATGGPAGAIRAGTKATIHAVAKKHRKVEQAVNQGVGTALSAVGLGAWGGPRFYDWRGDPWERYQFYFHGRFPYFYGHGRDWEERGFPRLERERRYLGALGKPSMQDWTELIRAGAQETRAIISTSKGYSDPNAQVSYSPPPGNQQPGGATPPLPANEFIPGVSNKTLLIGTGVVALVALSNRR